MISLISKIKDISLLCILLLGSISLTAQSNDQTPLANSAPLSKKTSSSLTVGDKVPDITIGNLINYPSAKARLSDFSGKLVIIDFWGTTCISCISALPKIDSLQKQFKNKLQVLTVTNFDTKEKVVKTLQRFKQTRNLQLPVVLDGEILRKYFPYEIVSHVVWIDPTGIVKAITGTEYITAANIQAVLDGEPVSWPVKIDVPDFNYEKPVLDFSNAHMAPPDFIYSSAITGYIDGIDATDKLFVDSINNSVTRNHFNHTLLQLCDGSLNGSGTGYIDTKQLLLHVKDPGRYLRGDDNKFYAEWQKKNTYTYSITLPLHLSNEETKEIIRTDLTRWLNVMGITVVQEKRWVNCLALVRTKQDDHLLKTKGGTYSYALDDAGKKKQLRNAPLTDLIGRLNEEKTNIPRVIDETAIPETMKIDLSLTIDSFDDLPALRSELQRYGLDLIPVKREMEMYVITEKGVVAAVSAQSKHALPGR